MTSLISYLIPNSENKANLDKEKEGEEEVQPVPTMAMGTQTTLGQLNVPGADQLRALIAADMEEERLNYPVLTDRACKSPIDQPQLP